LPTRAVILSATLASLIMIATTPSFADEPPVEPPEQEAKFAEVDLHAWSAVGKLNNLVCSARARQS